MVPEDFLGAEMAMNNEITAQVMSGLFNFCTILSVERLDYLANRSGSYMVIKQFAT